MQYTLDEAIKEIQKTISGIEFLRSNTSNNKARKILIKNISSILKNIEEEAEYDKNQLKLFNT